MHAGRVPLGPTVSEVRVLYLLVYLSWNTADHGLVKGKGDLISFHSGAQEKLEIFIAQQRLKLPMESILNSVHLLFHTIRRWKGEIIHVGIVESHSWQGGDRFSDRCYRSEHCNLISTVWSSDFLSWTYLIFHSCKRPLKGQGKEWTWEVMICQLGTCSGNCEEYLPILKCCLELFRRREPLWMTLIISTS